MVENDGLTFERMAKCSTGKAAMSRNQYIVLGVHAEVAPKLMRQNGISRL